MLAPVGVQCIRSEPISASKICPLPAGDYYLVGIPEEISRDWQESAFLDALSRVASTVTIGEGDKKTIDLRSREVRP